MDLGVKHVSFKEGFHFLAEEVLEDLGVGEVLISDLQVRACTIAHKDMKYAAHERFKVRDVTLKNLWANL